MKTTTTGLWAARRRSITESRTSFAGGLEITTITLTGGSWSNRATPSFKVVPSTAAFRSRPPVPMALVTPPPSL